MIKILCAFCLILFLSGCGHNVFTWTSGKYGNVGYDPQTSKFGIQYGNGDIISVIEKDNASLTVENTDTLDVNGQVTAKTTKITYVIKEQITGADVDYKQAEK